MNLGELYNYQAFFFFLPLFGSVSPHCLKPISRCMALQNQQLSKESSLSLLILLHYCYIILSFWMSYSSIFCCSSMKLQNPILQIRFQ